MKKFLVLSLMVMVNLFVFSCGSKPKNKNTEEFSTNENKVVSADAIAEGQALVKSSDCSICHHVTNKIVGPAHLEVAKKYEFTTDNVKMLANKIINGGNGVWGDMAMSPHTDISYADAEKMARYVLSLDEEKEH